MAEGVEAIEATSGGDDPAAGFSEIKAEVASKA
jgi:hypothetical protein